VIAAIRPITTNIKGEKKVHDYNGKIKHYHLNLVEKLNNN